MIPPLIGGARSTMTYPLIIQSCEVPAKRPAGIFRFSYGKGNGPRRMRYLHPAALHDLEQCGPIILSDMARSPEAQIEARQTRKGSQTVAEGGHVKLVCVDLSVRATMRELELKSKRTLDEYMAERNWYCHRRDHRGGFESWHYNWILDFDSFDNGDRRTNAVMQRFTKTLYGHAYSQTKRDVQHALADLGFYGGDLDGIHGPLTRAAVKMAQRAYMLKVDGIPGRHTQKTLAVAAARFSDGHGRFGT